jgi:hypothetical protein
LLWDINKKLNYFNAKEHKASRPYMPPRINPPKRIKRVITLARGKCTGTSTADAFISNGFWLENCFLKDMALK